MSRISEKSGLDGVELHGGSGYLIEELISPYSNKRIDEYGGCIRYLNKQMERLGVKVNLGIEATPEIPSLPGYGQDNVVSV
ncbi:MAG: hypothetical protein KKC46_02835 [Proteobacteria bacterium]|nr:hypothetical protein [Pseudomonadota bacterium]